MSAPGVGWAAKWAARLGAGLVLLAAGCGGPPPHEYKPLRYDYLLPLRLNVGSVDVENHWAPGSPSDVSAQSPAVPEQALEQMAHDRLFAAGNAGRAVFVIDDASILRTDNTLNGSMAVHLDIIGPNGGRSGYAEARVARTVSGPAVDDDTQLALYNLTRQMMDDMNVEFEYQVRRSLKDWLQATPTGPAGLTAPVQQQALPPPPGVSAAPAAAPPPGSETPPLGTVEPGTAAPGAPQTLAPPVVVPATPAAPAYPAPVAPPAGATDEPAPGSEDQAPAPYQPPTYQPPSYQAPAYQPPAYQPSAPTALPPPVPLAPATPTY